VYYKAATSSPRKQATCGDCVRDVIIMKFFSIYLTVAAVVLSAITGVVAGRRYMSERLQVKLRRIWTVHLKRLWLAAKPLNKGKILIGERSGVKLRLLPGVHVSCACELSCCRACQAS
jgi:hypothetical protein